MTFFIFILYKYVLYNDNVGGKEKKMDGIAIYYLYRNKV